MKLFPNRYHLFKAFTNRYVYLIYWGPSRVIHFSQFYVQTGLVSQAKWPPYAVFRLYFELLSFQRLFLTPSSWTTTSFPFFMRAECEKDENHHSVIIFRSFMVYRGSNDSYLVGGRLLVHTDRWDTNKSIGFIVKQYVDYTIHNYSKNSTIVFDGYLNGYKCKKHKSSGEFTEREYKFRTGNRI